MKPPPFYRCFVRVAPNGEIQEAQFGAFKRALPGGYTELPQRTRGFWPELSRYAGARFYMDDGQLRRKREVAIAAAPSERVQTGEIIRLSIVGASIERPTYRVNGDTVVQSDGPVFEIAWDNPAVVTVELVELPFRANLIQLSWEDT